jgi:hypothetical protein
MKTNKFYAFDNGGETFDRFTIIDNGGEMLGLSENPNSPLGFSQWAGNCVDNYMFASFGYAWRRQCDVEKVIKHELPRIIQEFKTDGNIGQMVDFNSLPIEVQQHAINRFNN